MSHQLRHEKDCLNCGATVEDRYCTHCGQENLPVKETFGHLFRHFFEDVTHYDSKIFTTIKDLLFKPGFLTHEYLRGKRASFLHPIRMYVFISFVYFLAMFTTSHASKEMDEYVAEKAVQEERARLGDSLHIPITHETVDFNMNLVGTMITYDVLKHHDYSKGGIKTWFYSRWLKTIDHYGSEGAVALTIEKTRHIIPKMMFLLLPLFALFLKWFYGKKYYYSDHAIFSLHLHSAIFLIFLFVLLVKQLLHIHHFMADITEYIIVFTYSIVALKNTYREPIGKTIAKGAGISVIYILCISAGFMVVALTALL